MPQLKILLIRNDKLGDFVLALPCFHWLKNSLPDAQVDALIPRYTQPIGELCSAVHQVIVDPGPQASLLQQVALIKRLRAEKYAVAISLFSTTRIGIILSLASIPYRLAPATKIAQLFYSQRLLQKRSLSVRSEYQYNLDLIEFFLRSQSLTVAALPKPPYLVFPQQLTQQITEQFKQTHQIPTEHALVFIHPGNGGSGQNLSIKQYQTLANQLRSTQGHTLVITSGPGEESLGQKVLAGITDAPAVQYISNQGLEKFTEFLSCATVFISSSTGTLHLAAALNRANVGFYASETAASALRWQTVSDEHKRLAISTQPGHHVQDIDCVDAAKQISQRFLLL